MAETTIKVSFVGDTSKLSRALGQVEQSTSRMSGTIKAKTAGIGASFAKIAGSVGALGAATVALKSTIDAGSDLAETMSKTRVIFGSSADAILKWSKTTATSMGQSRQSALDAAATFATFGSAAGLSGDKLTSFSTGLTGLSSDLASFYNTDPSEAIEAIGAALRGESEPIRKYGVLLNEATLRTEALKLGLVKTTKQALTPQQKVLAAQAAILAQTQKAQGDFARTADGAANKQRVLSARVADLQASLGQKLLPVYAAIVSFLSDKLIPAFQRVAAWVSTNWPQISAAIVGAVQKVYNYMVPVINTFQALWRRFGETITKYVVSAFETVKKIIGAALQVISGIIDVVTGIISGKWGRAWDGIKKIVAGVWDAIKALIGGAINSVKTVLALAWDAIGDKVRSAWDHILSFFKAIPDRVGTAFKTLGKTIVSPFKAAFNEIAKLWNNTVGKLSFHVPSWVPGIGGKGFDVPDIPMLASGGVVTRPTLAMIGEAGPEAVVPLSKFSQGGNVFQITVNALDPQTAAVAVVDALKTYERTRGPVPIRTRVA